MHISALLSVALAMLALCRASERVVLDTQHDWDLVKKISSGYLPICKTITSIVNNFNTSESVQVSRDIGAFSLGRWHAVHAFVYLDGIATTQASFNFNFGRHLKRIEAANMHPLVTMYHHRALFGERIRYYETFKRIEEILQGFLAELIDQRRMSAFCLKALQDYQRTVPTIESVFQAYIGMMHTMVEPQQSDAGLADEMMRRHPEQVPIKLLCSTRGCSEQGRSTDSSPEILVMALRNESAVSFLARSRGLMPCACLTKPTSKLGLFFKNRSNGQWEEFPAGREMTMAELYKHFYGADKFVHLAFSR